MKKRFCKSDSEEFSLGIMSIKCMQVNVINSFGTREGDDWDKMASSGTSVLL